MWKQTLDHTQTIVRTLVRNAKAYDHKALCMVQMHIPTSSYLLISKCNYHEITSCSMYSTTSSKSTNLVMKITVNRNFTMPLLTCITMVTCDKMWKYVGSNPGPYTEYGKNSCDINLGPIGYEEQFIILCTMSPFTH